MVALTHEMASNISASTTRSRKLSEFQFAAGRIRRGGRFNESLARQSLGDGGTRR
jgi:hypothetical protein